MKAGKQTTIRRIATLVGTGVHSGYPLSLAIHPAEADTGIVFVRVEAGEEDREIRAEPGAVSATEFATVIGDAAGPAISTVEHVMAALFALGIDNARVEVDGPEIPILDGSAAPFVEALESAGIAMLRAPRRFLRVLKPVGVVSGQAYGELRPYARGLRVEIDIDFDHPGIGRQAIAMDVTPASFRRDFARARTFGFASDVRRLWNAGYALGASLDNTLVLGEDRVLNPEGLRYADEFVRHKALDAIGDLALAGMPILGAYRSTRGGHRLNYAVLCALLSDPTAWTIVESREPARRAPVHAPVPAGLLQPVFAPERD